MDDDQLVDLGIAGLGPAVRIGSGGFADVFRAQQINLRREVAVKVLRAPASDEPTRMRFERECHAMGPLSAHPNIVSVHEGGFTPDGRAYLVMEYFTGGSLADRLHQSGPLPADDVVGVGIEIGGALGVAHDAGVLHRDVKPANILVSAYGVPALGDFGIARVEGGHQTASGQVTASFAHAAPEVLESHAPGPASDLYSLGSTLFELFVGRPPHLQPGDHSIWALMNRVLTEPIPDPESLGMPRPLADVVRRATARDPHHRYQRADDLVAELTGSRPRSAPAPVTVPAPAVSAHRGHGGADAAAVANRSSGWHGDTDRSGGGPGSEAATVAEQVPHPVQRTVAQPAATSLGAAPRRRGGLLLAALGLLILAVGAGVAGWYVASQSALGASGATGSSTTTTQAPGPEVVLELPEAAAGPLEPGERYDLAVTGLEAGSGARVQLLVDDEPVGEPTAGPVAYEASPGRHQVAVEVTVGEDTHRTDPVPLYVLGEPPEPGSIRVNLASNRAEARSWPATLSQFDRLVADGHDGLRIHPNNDPDEPRWHLFVPGFPDRASGDEYCLEFGLDDRNHCYTSQVPLQEEAAG